jgi:HEAT repeat protein
MVKVVRDLGNEASLPVLRKLTQSPHHYVRWSAIQAAAALDGVVGLVLLRAAANDPHPHIRDTARRVIAQAPVHQAS